MSILTTLSRQALYDRVWTTPMTKLAAEFGISGRGLAKLCERHAIPVPGRGHWARRQAGYRDEPDELPTTPPHEAEVRISGEPDKEPEHPDVETRLAYEGEHPIVVPETLRQPHRLVIQARESLRPQLPGERYDAKWNPFHMNVSSKLVPRTLRFYDTLIKECEKRGFPVSVPKEPRSEMKIRVHDEELSVGIDEPNRRSEHVLTQREEAEKRAGKLWYSPKYDYTRTGQLIFTINEWGDGDRRRWTDREKRPIENCLNEIIVALVRTSVTCLKPRRIEAERRERERAEEERRQWAFRAKVDVLERNMKAWQENQKLRAFVAAVEEAAQARKGTVEGNSPINEWLAWARSLADWNDPMEKFLERLANGSPEPSYL
jgi:hypothetical protein